MSIVFEKELPVGIFKVYNELPDFEFSRVNQVHSNIVIQADRNLLRRSSSEGEKERPDGLYALNHDLHPMGIKTADCLPIVAIGEHGVAMLHAGWRGVAGDIFSPANLEKINPHYFFIGPAISVDSYEVGEEFEKHFPHLPQCFKHHEGKIYFDLTLAAQTLLQRHYPSAKIESTDLDTYSNADLHSFRRNKTELRNWNIWLPNDATA